MLVIHHMLLLSLRSTDVDLWGLSVYDTSVYLNNVYIYNMWTEKTDWTRATICDGLATFLK